MALLEEILEHNKQFVKEREQPLSARPAKKIALFTCMDTRLVEFLEPAMGLRRGDAQIIKNAGTAVIDPSGGVVRSLVVAVYGMGCEEIYVVGHLDCGMGKINEEKMEADMLARGVTQAQIGGLKPSLKEWLGTFRDGHENVRRVVKGLRVNPLIPDDVPIHGLMFDPVSGRLELLTGGYEG
ncbi:MAG: carbonic anhydrase [Chloroflexi bacterium]|nr:carbonic anhydrase [Chloroflexota bacterium]